MSVENEMSEMSVLRHSRTPVLLSVMCQDLNNYQRMKEEEIDHAFFFKKKKIRIVL